MYKLSFGSVILIKVNFANASTECDPKYGGGYNCYNHHTGKSSVAEPTYDGYIIESIQ